MYIDLPVDYFSTYIEAVNNYNARCNEYLSALKEANNVLNSIKKRQAAEHSQIAAKLADLENEEKRLKLIVRQHVLRGENPLSADLKTGARLAIITEEKEALHILSDKRIMTDAEKKLWVQALGDLSDAESKLLGAVQRRETEYKKLKSYVFSVEYWGASVPNTKKATLISEAYDLNKDGGADDEEEV